MASRRTALSTIVERDHLVQLLPAIVALADSEKEALGFWPENSLREAIDRGRLIALAADGELSGYIHYSGVFPHAKIQQVATSPAWRRQGIASTLIRTLVAKLESRGFLSLKAEIAETLAGSLAFYRRSGFVEVMKRKGGSARNRAILVHVRELESDNLFAFADRQQAANLDLGIRRRSASEDPLYAFDLNVYFDLVRDRRQSDNARALFGAALAHRIRLTVSDEFARELKRTSSDQANDPVLQMALRLPRLPSVDRARCEELAAQIHQMVFVGPGLPSAGSTQSLSDAAHIAHAALSRASAFITRDGTLLSASGVLLEQIGIDVISVDEITSLLLDEAPAAAPPEKSGTGFSFGEANEAEIEDYRTLVSLPAGIASEFCVSPVPGTTRLARAIRTEDGPLAIGILLVSQGMQPIARMLVHAREDQPDAGLFADFLIDRLTRDAAGVHPTAVELLHIAGQSSVNRIAQSRGFVRSRSGSAYQKIALGRPLTEANWAECAAETRRRTGFTLPVAMPTTALEEAEVPVTSPGGEVLTYPASQLGDLLSPAIVIWPGGNGVIVPIAKAYADELLGTAPQHAFAFMEAKDAAFLARRAYVSAPRNAPLMPMDGPILFYESSRTGGRGAVVAVGRVVDRTLQPKAELSADSQRRLVVDDVDAFSATDDILITSFDNLFALPVPVPLGYLKAIGAAGNANLISAVSLPSEKITQILTQGWLRDLG
ncbi:ribosomal protein S18 acetylase RimI-like enzyme [Sphingopyxis sp. OAS728]|uniref:GNAT family N-acetyltransferase n=1 Tax=Sphingopyxis sp. OAS728 TaxID=2663823 RepID=UPI001789985E|nr:GNAT family N-acetyltransferase [Sphingopyxis sp. OAS728]MBE1528966.1 ribosomal protein S18 acetylase RimI-like enzyme [Sphingopyxis sp. OAS728]